MLTDGAKPVDDFATLIRKLDAGEMEELRRMAARADWREVTGRNYDTADVIFWETCKRAFFIRMRSGGDIPRHHDAFIPGTTHHLVLQTNDHCINGWQDTQGRDQVIHMREGHRYQVERSPLHWATNHGETDRIHLLVEF